MALFDWLFRRRKAVQETPDIAVISSRIRIGKESATPADVAAAASAGNGDTSTLPAGEAAKRKGTREDGTLYYQDVYRNRKNGFRVQRGEKGEERYGYPTAGGGFVWKRRKRKQ